MKMVAQVIEIRDHKGIPYLWLVSPPGFYFDSPEAAKEFAKQINFIWELNEEQAERLMELSKKLLLERQQEFLKIFSDNLEGLRQKQQATKVQNKTNKMTP